MADDELRLMLDWRPSQIPFQQLSAEWKAWATAMIKSAKVLANQHAHIRLEDSVRYLCRILCVFEGLFRGITAADLLGKFVSGLVLSGLTPERDRSFYFEGVCFMPCAQVAIRTFPAVSVACSDCMGWEHAENRPGPLYPTHG